MSKASEGASNQKLTNEEFLIAIEKQMYIGNYINNKMIHCSLPISMEYYEILAKHTEAAEKSWKNYINKKKKI